MEERELPEDPWYLKKPEAAKRLGISVPTFNRMIASGVVRVYRIKGTRLVRFHVKDIDELVEEQKETGRPRRHDVESATG